MTKKDYIKIGDLIKRVKKKGEFMAGWEDAIKFLENNLVKILKEDNENFDEQRFREYVKTKEENNDTE